MDSADFSTALPAAHPTKWAVGRESGGKVVLSVQSVAFNSWNCSVLCFISHGRTVHFQSMAGFNESVQN